LPSMSRFLVWRSIFVASSTTPLGIRFLIRNWIVATQE
jgi:hypothetical protein